jgi:hypothetical protein
MGRKVRLYDADDFFWDGTVTKVCENIVYADVDYGDWVQRYPITTLVPTWMQDGSYEHVLVPRIFGKIVTDYR